METKDFFIEKRIREKLGNGRRIYNIIAGIFFMFIGGNAILEKGLSISDSSLILNVLIILFSILMFAFGLLGKEPIRTRYRLEIDHEYLRAKKTFEIEASL